MIKKIEKILSYLRIYSKLRVLLKSSIIPYIIFLKLKDIINKKYTIDGLVNSKTDICLGGFPRSANGYFYLLMQNLRTDLNYAHHIHSIINIKLAFKMKIPIIILFRKPIDAISSLIIYSNSDNLFRDFRFYYEDYKKYYNFTLKNRKYIFHIKFEDIINKTQEVLLKINNFIKFKKDLNEINLDQLNKTCFEIIEVWNRNRKGGFKKISIPSKKKEKYKLIVKNFLERKFKRELQELNKIYIKLCERSIL